MATVVGMGLLALLVVALWQTYVGLYGQPPLALRDGPYGMDAWVPLAVLGGVVAVTVVLPVVIERLRPERADFRDQIATNDRNSALLVIAFVAGVALVADIVGTVVTLRTSAGLVAAAIASVAALAAAWLALRRGDRLILAMSGARELPRSEAPVLHDVVGELAIAAAVPVPRIFRVSGPPNAFVTGPDPSRAALVVTDGLLRDLDREELQGVIAHELAHVRNHDARYTLLVTVLIGSMVLIADGAFAIVTFPFRLVGKLIGAGYTPDAPVQTGGSGGSWSWPKFGGGGGSGGGGGGGGGGDGDGDGGGLGAILLAVLIFILVVVLVVWFLKVVVPLLGRLGRAAVGREREYLADAAAVDIGRNPAALESALAKVASARGEVEGANRATAPLFFVSPIDRFEAAGRALFATHPPTLDRINRLRRLRGMPAITEVPAGARSRGR